MKISDMLQEIFIRKTLDDIFNYEKFAKLCIYKKFKKDLKLENYLN